MDSFWLKFSRAPASPAIFAGAVCLILYLAGSLSRPIFPVDETRYLTVAWEMFSHQEWILPSLNFEPYHHKPPLLFWLIMGVWSIFGVSQGAAMVVPYLIGFAVIVLSARLSSRLAPDRPELPMITAAVAAGSLPFAIYSHLIMFDLLLTVFVLIGVTATLDFAKDGKKRHLALFALAIGGGVLAKGPVILLHLLPLVLLVRFWKSGEFAPSYRKWAIGFFVAVLGGALLALSWAIPAAIKGGPEFSDKIFWGQTAGRMVKSFDHERPVWWYLMFLPLFALPWAFSPALWKGAKELKSSQLLKILACWMIPVFIGFSLISGKQVHYLLPLLPSLALLISVALHTSFGAAEKVKGITVLFAVPFILALLPAPLSLLAQQIEDLFPNSPHISETLGQMSLTLPLTCAAVIAALAFVSRAGKPGMQLVLVALAMTAMMSSFLLEAKRGFFVNYDLMPIAKVIQANPGRPLAFVRNYHGEFGFLARLNTPVKQLGPGELRAWFTEHPDGIAFIRTRKEGDFAPYDVLFTMPYRMTNTYGVVVKKGEKDNFVTP